MICLCSIYVGLRRLYHEYGVPSGSLPSLIVSAPNTPTISIPPPFIVTSMPNSFAKANASDRSFTSSTHPLPDVSFQFTLYILLLYIFSVSVSSGAQKETRTPTPKHSDLNAACLPIPPSGHIWCGWPESNRQAEAADFKSAVFTYFTTPALFGADNWIRTSDLFLTKEVHYLCVISALEEGGGIEPQPLHDRSAFETVLGPA